MAQALKKWSSDLTEKGFAEYSLGESGLPVEDYNYLKSQTDESRIEYVVIGGGDTNETASAEVYRLKHPANQNVNLEDCVEVLASEDFLNFVRAETGVQSFDFDRVQAHIYRSGDFLAKHVDSDSADYLYTFIFTMQQAEEGGEFVLFFGDDEYVLKPKEGSLLILDSRIPHEVRPVKKGIRKTLCAFMKKI